MASPVARSEQLKGARVGAHEILELIGHGATASVYEGTHVALGKSVAVKVLHEHLAHDDQIAHRFLREGRVAARLRHPNIVEVLDVGVEQGIPYLVMELLHGADLRALLLDTKVIDLSHALAFLLPIASALSHAHESGVVHRDLKPANVFLARDVRDDVLPKLLDFGLSKAAGFDDARLTATELVAGTVLYMAPEQTLGMKNATPASDQYALAAILYECLTGAPPHEGDGVYAIIDKIRSGAVVPPSARNVALPAAIDPILLRALDRDPEQRFPSVRMFARELLAFAPVDTVAALSRDFGVRTGDAARAASSWPSLRRASVRVPASPEAVTRFERSGEVSGMQTIAPLPCAPGSSPFHIKGNPYRGLMHFVSTSLPGGVDAFCAALDDPRLRAFVRQPFLATSRYDILPFLPLTATLARLIGAPFEAFVRTATIGQARYDAKTVYRRIFEGTTVGDIPTRISRFNTNYYDFGEWVGARDAPGTFYIEHRGFPAYLHPWYTPMNLAYTEECARLVGGRDVKASAGPLTPAGKKGTFELVSVRLTLSWKEPEEPK